jgi:hypothetical protein
MIFPRALIVLLSLFLPATVFPTPAGVGEVSSAQAIDSELDPVSAACIACHDGTSAMSVNYCMVWQKDKPGCGGHIISADYVALAAKDKGLRSLPNLPAELVLYEGKITCVTCHGDDPHNVPFAIDSFGGALCRACHLK